jgi:hypothetical protein
MAITPVRASPSVARMVKEKRVIGPARLAGSAPPATARRLSSTDMLKFLVTDFLNPMLIRNGEKGGNWLRK